MFTIEPTPLAGAAEINCSPDRDGRGWFARFFCQESLHELNGGRPIQQINSSFSEKRGTLRGLHFQYPPASEDKLVRCIAGQVYDVMVDLRKHSATLGQWHGVVLDAAKMNMVYIPKGFAHGFQTLRDNCQMLYLHTALFAPEREGGINHASPALAIPWPLPISEISTKDRDLEHFSASFQGLEV